MRLWTPTYKFSSSCTGDPHNDPNAQGDAFKTLFVARVVSPQLPFPGASEESGTLGCGELECGTQDNRLGPGNVLRALGWLTSPT